MRRYTKKIISVVLCIILIFNYGTISSFAEDNTVIVDESVCEKADTRNLEDIEISDTEAAELLNRETEEHKDEVVVGSRNWEKYSSDYLYSNMNAAEQAYYNQLDETCKAYISTDRDAMTYGSSGDYMYLLDAVSYEGLTYDEAKGLIYIFLYQNPQYYFIDSKYLFNSSSKTIWMSAYSIFADGNDRAAITGKMFAKVDAWITEINQESTVYYKEKKVHDIVCVNTIYLAGDYDQSAYSAIMLGKTVCAGYTKMFSMLANGVGIDTIGVLGSNHAWNKCYIDGAWYNVDTTWDDGDDYIWYIYFNKSDTSSAFSTGHSQYSWYEGRTPDAPADYDIWEYSITPIYVTSVSLNQTSLTLDENTTKTLNYTIKPDDATDTAIVWTSSDESVAAVSQSGVVTAKKNGYATITATTNNSSKMATCGVRVNGTVQTPTTDATVTSNGIYLASHTNNMITAGLVATPSKSADLEYRWLACDTSVDSEKWTVIQNWTINNEWLNWNPNGSGDYVIVAQVRVVGNESSQAQSSIGIQHHQYIKGKCQMPYTGEGGGYLIGIETYDNPNQEYSYELLVLDCTLLADGKDAWVWSTGKCKVPEKSFWAVWQPQYGYYWTLFRVYDAKGNMIDQECYPFVNAY